jgi:glucose-6-phosphate-specific signal transduction histidine kinase
MIMENKYISLVIASLGLAVMIACICSLYTFTTNNDLMLAVIGFSLSGMVAGVAIINYDHLDKKRK